MDDSENLPLSAFMPHHPSSDPHAPFTAKAGKKRWHKKREQIEQQMIRNELSAMRKNRNKNKNVSRSNQNYLIKLF